jgi:hypothetical protein
MSSRLPTWLIVAGVGALIVLAAADAIRPHGELSAAPTTTVPMPRVRGMFLFPGPGCDPVAVRLPRALAEHPPRLADCGGFVWSADGTLAARCHGEVTNVYGPQMETLGRLAGCAPAWRPDGVLSVIRDGDLVTARRHGRPQVFLSRDALADELKREVGSGYQLSEVAWIDPQTFAAIVRGPRRWQQALVVGSRDRLELIVPERGQRISSITVSPLGKLAFARNQLGREFVMLDRSGRELALPRIANVRALAWSPDERWVALATRTTTSVARTGSREVVLRIPLGGESLAWLP